MLIRRLRIAAVLLAVAFASAGRTLAAQATRDVSRLDARPSPQWVHDALVYEINERTFSPSGTFNGITDRLDSLRTLGATILWLMPIHPIGQLKKKGSIGSPYAVRDYYGIEPAFGTKDDLHRLITEAHRRGLKVIIDIVANHTSWDAKMMATPSYYVRDAQGHVVTPYDWTDVAKLDYGNPATRRYMLDMLKYWLRDFDLDGFRCDVAGDVPTDFWEEARAELEKIKPDIVMLAEAHKPELLVKAFDMDYSWPLYGTMAEVINGGLPALAIPRVWQEEVATYPHGALHLRFTENHDEKRAIDRFGERAAVAAGALAFTMDGVPLLYNGQEAADVTESGAPALFERLPIFWQGAERRPDVVAFFRAMIPLRREHHALREGSLQWIHNSDEDRVLTFVRRDSAEEILVAINLSNRPFTGTVEAAGPGYVELTPRGPAGPGAATGSMPVALPAVALDAWGWRMFRRNR